MEFITKHAGAAGFQPISTLLIYITLEAIQLSLLMELNIMYYSYKGTIS